MQRSSSNTASKRFSVGTDALARPCSAAGIDKETIKSVSQRFDVDIVFKLILTNRGISSIGGLDDCINLLELNLTGNVITRISGLDALPQLRRLILTSNRIERIENLATLTQLESLHLQGNLISDIPALNLPELAALTSLKSLYLQNLDRGLPNPVCSRKGYKIAVLSAVGSLTNLDGERSPASQTYMELSAEAAHLAIHPLPRLPVIVPAIQPWLSDSGREANGSLPDANGSADSASTNGRAGAGAVSPEGDELQARHGVLVKKLDECQMLSVVLREEVGKWRVQLVGGG